MENVPPMAEQSLPKTMKAAIATGFGEIDDNIRVVNDWLLPVPTFKGKDEVLIRVLACALAPGDVRVLTGKTDWIQLPKGGHPYIVGSDVSGIVVASNTSENDKFKTGDYVVSRFELPGPVGGLAEYKVVNAHLTEQCPKSIDPIQACGLTASAMAAKKIVTQFVQKGDRVLVIGGSGGVGSSVLQYLKLHGAGYVAAVSTQETLCKCLGADRVIDYRSIKWWEIEEFQEHPFNVVIDMVGGNNWDNGGCLGKAVARNGKYVALPPGVRSDIELHGWVDLASISVQWMRCTLWSRLNRRAPRYVIADGLDLQDGDLRDLLKDVLDGRLHPVLDPASPFEFTEAGVRQAFHLQKSRHAHGKVVVKVADAE